jgi:hypothetical protein
MELRVRQAWVRGAQTTMNAGFGAAQTTLSTQRCGFSRVHPPRTQPSSAVSHPADARHRALGGTQHTAWSPYSQRRILSKSWEKVTSPKKL